MEHFVLRLKIIGRLKNANYFRRLFKKNRNEIKLVFESLADKKSKDVLKKILRARKSWIRENSYYWRKIAFDKCTEYSFTTEDGFEVFNTQNQYFIDDFLNLNFANLVMVDGGAYRGDTIELLNLLSNKQFKYVYAFEPLKENYVALKRVIEKAQVGEKVEMFQIGLDNQQGVALFENQGELAVAGAGQYVEINTDIASKYINLKMKHLPNFIKLDIEGKEKEVLRDLKDYISELSPDLAICIYHKVEDLWEIPLMIKKINPKYKIYIRHHSNYYTETVCYATVGRNQDDN
jgi:FkbM family methyltransferase